MVRNDRGVPLRNFRPALQQLCVEPPNAQRPPGHEQGSLQRQLSVNAASQSFSLAPPLSMPSQHSAHSSLETPVATLPSTPVDEIIRIPSSASMAPPSLTPRKKRPRRDFPCPPPLSMAPSAGCLPVTDFSSQRSIDHFMMDSLTYGSQQQALNLSQDSPALSLMPPQPPLAHSRVPAATHQAPGRPSHGARFASAAVLSDLTSLTNPYLSREIPTEAAQQKILKALRSTKMRRFSIEFDHCGELGRGSFSTAVRARHRIDGSLYAVKRSSRALTNNFDRFSALREVFALATLNHPNILVYHGAWFEDNFERLYIQTDLYDKGSLSSNAENVAADPKRLRDLLSGLSSALKYMHERRIVHLDLKPENIFISEGNAFVLGDFGMSCRSDGANYSGLDGDSRYLCPTLLASHGLDGVPSGHLEILLPAADIFALGVTMIEVALGTPMTSDGPAWLQIRNGNFGASPMYEELRQRCGDDIAAIITNCIRLKVSSRPTASDICETLAGCGGVKEGESLRKRLATAEAARDRYKKRADDLEKALREVVTASSSL